MGIATAEGTRSDVAERVAASRASSYGVRVRVGVVCVHACIDMSVCVWVCARARVHACFACVWVCAYACVCPGACGYACLCTSS